MSRGKPSVEARSGGAAGDAAAIDRAAAILRRARRVLVTGLVDASLEAIQAACDVAEALGAAIDPAVAETASPLGPLVVRAGSVTADLEELRDRADLVICWCCVPDDLRPGFGSEFLTGRLPDGRPRTVIAAGPAAGPGSRHVAFPETAATDSARLLHAILVGHDPPADNAAAVALAPACQELAAAIRAAGCIGVVASRTEDPFGLSTWAVHLLVRAIAHERPGFLLLVPATAGRLDDEAGAAAVLSWRYGAGGGIARADRLGGDFRPGECSAAALVARGEVDAVLAVGRLPADLEEAIAGRAADLSIVRVDERADVPPGCAGECLHLRCQPATGTILRHDGRERRVGDGTAAGHPGSMAALLGDLLARIGAEVPP